MATISDAPEDVTAMKTMTSTSTAPAAADGWKLMQSAGHLSIFQEYALPIPLGV